MEDNFFTFNVAHFFLTATPRVLFFSLSKNTNNNPQVKVLLSDQEAAGKIIGKASY